MNWWCRCSATDSVRVTVTVISSQLAARTVAALIEVMHGPELGFVDEHSYNASKWSMTVVFVIIVVMGRLSLPDVDMSHNLYALVLKMRR